MEECELDRGRSWMAPAVPSLRRCAMLGLCSDRLAWRGACGEMRGYDEL